MKRFNLVRLCNLSRCSGEGVVAEGAVFRSGKAVLSWFEGRAGAQSTGIYDSVEDLLAIHGHDGRTVLEFVDSKHGRRTSSIMHSVVIRPNKPGVQQGRTILQSEAT